MGLTSKKYVTIVSVVLSCCHGTIHIFVFLKFNIHTFYNNPVVFIIFSGQFILSQAYPRPFLLSNNEL